MKASPLVALDNRKTAGVRHCDLPRGRRFAIVLVALRSTAAAMPALSKMDSHPLVAGERKVPGQERYLITPNTRGFGSTDP